MFRGDIPLSMWRVCRLCLSSFILHCFRPQGEPTLSSSRDRTGRGQSWNLRRISYFLWQLSRCFHSKEFDVCLTVVTLLITSVFLLFRAIYFHVFSEIVIPLLGGDITTTGLPEPFDSLY